MEIPSLTPSSNRPEQEALNEKERESPGGNLTQPIGASDAAKDGLKTTVEVGPSGPAEIAPRDGMLAPPSTNSAC